MTPLETVDLAIEAAHDRWLHDVWIGAEEAIVVESARIDALLETRFRLVTTAPPVGDWPL